MSDHKHLCPKCGHIWHHDQQRIRPSEKMYEAAHTCPVYGCGGTTRVKYYGRFASKEEWYGVAGANPEVSGAPDTKEAVPLLNADGTKTVWYKNFESVEEVLEFLEHGTL